LQHLRRRAWWDPAAVRAALRSDSVPHLGDPKAVLGRDATGVRKKGRHSAGVARPSSGTAGQGANGPSGGLRGEASELGHVLLDRELSLPEEWTAARERVPQRSVETTLEDGGVVLDAIGVPRSVYFIAERYSLSRRRTSAAPPTSLMPNVDETRPRV
jgi:hypothetical protein